MEALSGAASGIAVVSLVIQLLQSVGTIKSFVRDVKGASKELERLLHLLDRLSALLDDVRNTMEQQTSLQGQHFPAPSMTIFNCLKGCEDSLACLDSIIDKYRRSQNGNFSALSTMSKFKDDIKLGFKKKDISEFELRIQREIDYLHTALGLNTTNILMTAIPGLLQNQHACMAVCTQLAQQPLFAQAPATSIASTELYPSQKSYNPRTVQRQVRASWSLARFGIYQRKSARYIRYQTDKMHGKQDRTEDIISSSHDLVLNWGFFRYGVQWVRRYPYGRIASSLSVYPVVKDNLFDRCDDFIFTSPMTEIQKLFSSGALHPFTRDTWGTSLLHVAAYRHRVDVCRLLIQYGLRPDKELSLSPLLFSLFNSPYASGFDPVDTVRFFLFDCDHVDDFENEYLGLYGNFDFDVLEWTWRHAVAVLDECSLLRFRSWLLTSHINQYPLNYEHLQGHDYKDRIIKLMNAEMVEHYRQGNIKLLRALFESPYGSLDSQRYGYLLTGLLSQLGLDVKSCIDMELENFPGGIIRREWPGDLDRKIVFEILDNGWSLRWIWVLDPCEPGYLLLSENIGLTCDTYFLELWPFSETWEQQLDSEKRTRTGATYEARFDRRMANKARKERARTGQRRTKSKMPGAWTW